MTISRSFFHATLLLAVTILAQSCKKPESQASTTSAGGISNTSEVISVTKRADKAPDFTWKDSTGATVHFDAYRGTLTIVNFWATWCGPCKRELPALVDLSKEYSGRGVKFIGISSDRGANIVDDVRAFVHENGLPYQIVVSNDDLDEAFGNIRGLPTSFVVNDQGAVVRTFMGARDKQFFASAIDSLLR
jgi:thiol-disulfide isomerase/thioredoxin